MWPVSRVATSSTLGKGTEYRYIDLSNLLSESRVYRASCDYYVSFCSLLPLLTDSSAAPPTDVLLRSAALALVNDEIDIIKMLYGNLCI